MGWKSKSTRAAVNVATDRRTSTLAAVAADTAANAGHSTAATVVSALNAVAMAADIVTGPTEPPEGGYATFSTDGETKRNGWRR